MRRKLGNSRYKGHKIRMWRKRSDASRGSLKWEVSRQNLGGARWVRKHFRRGRPGQPGARVERKAEGFRQARTPTGGGGQGLLV